MSVKRDTNQVTKAMRSVHSKDTDIEVKLRKALWRNGYRYRKNVANLPGKPDIVMPKYHLIIFCDAEFWHGKDWDNLKEQLEGGHNSDYWIKKIERNRERDVEVDWELREMGWTVLRFWRKDILSDIDGCLKVIDETIFDIKMRSVDDEYDF